MPEFKTVADFLGRGGGSGGNSGLQGLQQVLQIQNLQSQLANRQAQGRKLEFDTQKAELEALGERVKAIRSGISAGMLGDEKTMQDVWAKARPEDVRIPKLHPDKNARLDGRFILENPMTGEITEHDTLAESRAQALIDLRVDVIKNNRKDILSLTQTYINNGITGDVRQATALAKQTVAEANKRAGLAKMSPEGVREQLRAEAQVEAALNVDLRKRRDLPSKNVETISGKFSSAKTLLQKIAPGFVNIQKKIPTTVGNNTIEDVLNFLGKGTPEYEFLRSSVGTVLFDRIKRDSGAAFTEEELAQRRKLLPTLKDSLPAAMAKIGALSILDIGSAQDEIRGFESAGFDTRNLRKLFSSFDFSQMPEAQMKSEAKSAVGLLPKSVFGDPKAVNLLVNVMPPELQDSFLEAVGERLNKGKSRAK